MIRNRLATTYNCQKSYAYNMKRDVEFELGDQVYMKLSPMKGLMMFGKVRGI